MEISRWVGFSKSEQLLFIASEFDRARIWQREDKEKFLLALERALELIDLSLADSKWRKDVIQLFTLRDEVAKFYAGLEKGDIGILYQAL